MQKNIIFLNSCNSKRKAFQRPQTSNLTTIESHETCLYTSSLSIQRSPQAIFERRNEPFRLYRTLMNPLFFQVRLIKPYTSTLVHTTYSSFIQRTRRHYQRINIHFLTFNKECLKFLVRVTLFPKNTLQKNHSLKFSNVDCELLRQIEPTKYITLQSKYLPLSSCAIDRNQGIIFENTF
jgi:hypothetical protein